MSAEKKLPFSTKLKCGVGIVIRGSTRRQL